MIGNFRVGTEDPFVNHGDGTFSCRRHGCALAVEVDPGDPGRRIASCPVCAQRAAALRGVIVAALGDDDDSAATYEPISARVALGVAQKAEIE